MPHPVPTRRTAARSDAARQGILLGSFIEHRLTLRIAMPGGEGGRRRTPGGRVRAHPSPGIANLILATVRGTGWPVRLAGEGSSDAPLRTSELVRYRRGAIQRRFRSGESNWAVRSFPAGQIR